MEAAVGWISSEEATIVPVDTAEADVVISSGVDDAVSCKVEVVTSTSDNEVIAAVGDTMVAGTLPVEPVLSVEDVGDPEADGLETKSFNAFRGKS